jgi:hypothetical protein
VLPCSLQCFRVNHIELNMMTAHSEIRSDQVNKFRHALIGR